MKQKQKTKQRSRWLNSYSFASAGWDNINTGLATVKRMISGLTKNTANQVDRVAQKRLAQVISQGGKSWKSSTYSTKKGNQKTV